MSILRWSADVADLADPGERHLERPRNRRRRQGEDVNRRAEALELVLGGHTEPLFLVDDEQAEVLECDVV